MLSDSLDAPPTINHNHNHHHKYGSFDDDYKNTMYRNKGNVMITAAAQKQQEGTIGTHRGGAKTRYDDDI